MRYPHHTSAPRRSQKSTSQKNRNPCLVQNHRRCFTEKKRSKVLINIGITVQILKVFYTKHFDEPTCEKFTEFHVETHRTWWCCKKLKEHDKHFQLWNVKWAKFYFKDISTDGNIAFFPMHFCPYCGEEIECQEVVK